MNDLLPVVVTEQVAVTEQRVGMLLNFPVQGTAHEAGEEGGAAEGDGCIGVLGGEVELVYE